LSATAEDIRSMSGMIEKILSQDYLTTREK
jgi:hypothetical protein